MTPVINKWGLYIEYFSYHKPFIIEQRLTFSVPPKQAFLTVVASTEGNLFTITVEKVKFRYINEKPVDHVLS